MENTHKKYFKEILSENDYKEKILEEPKLKIKFIPEKPNPRGRPKRRTPIKRYINGKCLPASAIYHKNKTHSDANKHDLSPLNDKDVLRGAE